MNQAADRYICIVNMIFQVECLFLRYSFRMLASYEGLVKVLYATNS